MGVFHLGTMTLKGLFSKPETLLYPIETKEPPEGLKGSVTIKPETCILCGICQRNCPCSAITVNKAERSWSINHFSCIQCFYCVRSCPKSSLSMDTHYTPPAAKIEDEVVTIPEAKKSVSAEE